MILVGVAVATFFAVSHVSTGSGAGIAAPNVEQQKVLINQAQHVVGDYAQSAVNEALVVSTTRRSISALAGYDTDPAMNPQLGSNDPVFVVALNGAFKDYGVQGPAPGPPRTGNQIVFVESVADMKLLDWYMRDTALDVNKLDGAHTTLDLSKTG